MNSFRPLRGCVILLFGTFFPALHLSCSASRSDYFILKLPAIPASWRSALGEPCWDIVHSEGVVGDDCPGSITVELDRCEVAWVLAFPHWPNRGLRPGLARPAGGLYPYALDDGELLLSWEGGLAARLYAELEASGAVDKARRFDWPRFTDAVKAVTAGGIDPWRSPLSLVLSDLMAQRFDRRRLRTPSGDSISLTLPNEGPWVTSSPFPPVLVGSSADVVLPDPGMELEDFLCFLAPSGYLLCSSDGSSWFPACAQPVP